MKFTYKYHADKAMLCKWACFLACSSISPNYVPRPGFTFKAGEQTAKLLLIWPRFSSWPLIKSPALFAIQDRRIAILLRSAVTCQFPALPDGEIRPSEARREMKNESLPTLLSSLPLLSYRARFVPYWRSYHRNKSGSERSMRFQETPSYPNLAYPHSRWKWRCPSPSIWPPSDWFIVINCGAGRIQRMPVWWGKAPWDHTDNH